MTITTPALDKKCDRDLKALEAAQAEIDLVTSDFEELKPVMPESEIGRVQGAIEAAQHQIDYALFYRMAVSKRIRASNNFLDGVREHLQPHLDYLAKAGILIGNARAELDQQIAQAKKGKSK